MSTPPPVECEIHHASLYATDVRAAVAFYTGKLGFRLGFTVGDPPTMAGVNLGHVQVFLEQGTPGPQGCSMYFVVDDADDLYEFHRAGGVEVVAPLADRAYGLRDYAVRDLHGSASRAASRRSCCTRASRSATAWRVRTPSGTSTTSRS